MKGGLRHSSGVGITSACEPLVVHFTTILLTLPQPSLPFGQRVSSALFVYLEAERLPPKKLYRLQDRMHTHDDTNPLAHFCNVTQQALCFNVGQLSAIFSQTLWRQKTDGQHVIITAWD